ncbi:MAG TPA: hypothetical protein VIW69_02125 [Candidatus Elarobacter sp.]
MFAIDHLPAALAGDEPRTGAFRRYLDAGGKVVWPGIAPLLFPSDPKTGDADFKNIGRGAAKNLHGVSFENTNFDVVSATPTAAGEAWGLRVTNGIPPRRGPSRTAARRGAASCASPSSTAPRETRST